MRNLRQAGASAQAALAAAVERVTWALTGVLVALVCANVFARYVLQVGWPWVEEVSRLLFVWVVFLGAFVALHRRQHMAIEFVTSRIDAALRHRVLLFSRVSVALFLVVMVGSGTSLVSTTHDLGRVTPILGISAAWGYLSVPVAGLLMLLDVLLMPEAPATGTGRAGPGESAP